MSVDPRKLPKRKARVSVPLALRMGPNTANGHPACFEEVFSGGHQVDHVPVGCMCVAIVAVSLQDTRIATVTGIG